MMPINIRRAIFCCMAALTLFGCSGKGPDLIDPLSGGKNQMALLAVDQGAGGDGELTRYSEISGLASTTDFADSNGAPLGKPIDALYSSFLHDQIYLLHRQEGSITVLNMLSRRKVAAITGFAAGDNGLCGLALSNYSEGWAICSGTPKLYEIDTRNYKVAREIDLPGRPTAVGTDSTGPGGYVLVGMIYDDGKSRIGVTRSNSTDFHLESTIDFPSPVLSIQTTADGRQVLVLTAGVAGGHPTLFFLDGMSLAITSSKDLFDASAMTSSVGQFPTFVRMTDDNYLYVAGSDGVINVDLQNPAADPLMFYPGTFNVIGLDPTTGLLYTYADGSGTVHRVDKEGNDLPEFAVNGTVRDILFVNSNEVR